MLDRLPNFGIFRLEELILLVPIGVVFREDGESFLVAVFVDQSSRTLWNDLDQRELHERHHSL